MNRYQSLLPAMDTLIAFESVGRLGSFTRAAVELSLTQSAVSKQMRQLEVVVGGKLFERQPRGVAMTRMGAELLVSVNMMLATMYQSVYQLRNLHQSHEV